MGQRGKRGEASRMDEGERARERFQPTSVCARTKERSGDRTSSTGIYMYFPFVCDPLDTRKPRHRKEGKGKLGIVEEEPEKKEKKVGAVLSNGPSSSTESFSPQYSVLLHEQSVPSPRRDAIATWKFSWPPLHLSLSLSLPTFARHFSSGTLVRQSYSPFRHYARPGCSIPSIWPCYIRSPSLIFLSCFLPPIRSPRRAAPHRFRTPFVLQRRVKSDWKVPAL